MNDGLDSVGAPMIATAPLGSLSGDRTMSSAGAPPGAAAPPGEEGDAPDGDAPEGDAPVDAPAEADAPADAPGFAACATAPLPATGLSSPLLWPHAATQQPSTNTALPDR